MQSIKGEGYINVNIASPKIGINEAEMHIVLRKDRYAVIIVGSN